MSADPFAHALAIIVVVASIPMALMVLGFGVAVVIAHARNWRAKPMGPELVELSFGVRRRLANSVIVDGDDPMATAEDDRRAVEALVALVALCRQAEMPVRDRPRVIWHGNVHEGSMDSVTVVETVPDPRNQTARAEAEALRRQFGMPARRDGRGR